MRIPNGRILLLLFALCAAAGLFMAGKNVYAAQTDRGEVTYETVGDYKHIIYANGQPLLIEASDAVNYARLYVDYNGNGIGEADEEITSFKGDGLLSGDGIYYQDTDIFLLIHQYTAVQRTAAEYTTQALPLRERVMWARIIIRSGIYTAGTEAELLRAAQI